MSFSLTSSAFRQGGMIPARYGYHGGNVSPDLAWSDLPEGTQSLALVVDDPDAPGGRWLHWTVYGLDPAQGSLPEGIAIDAILPDGARQGLNDFRWVGYGGPCPPSGPPHHYRFRLYALDTTLTLPAGAVLDALNRAIQGHILGRAELVGLFRR